MAKTDDFLKNLQNMEPDKLKALLKQVTRSLSPAQQQSLKKMASDPDALAKLKAKVSDGDLDALQKNMGSAEELSTFLNQSDIQKKMDQLF